MPDNSVPKTQDFKKLGCELCQQAQYTEAIAAFDAALAQDCKDCHTWNFRGNALSGLKRYAEALAAYDKAVALSPDYHQAWFNRGLLLTEMMAYGNAVESYERAIGLYPDPAYLHAKDSLRLKHQVVFV